MPKKKITLINPNKKKMSGIGKFDLVISLASCGFHYPVATYGKFFSKQISKGGAVVLDIRKGSGGIRDMKSFGAVDVLAKHPKYSTVLARADG